VMDLTGMVKLIHSTVDQSFAPVSLHIFIYDHDSAHYQAMADEYEISTSDIRFPLAGVLAQVLREKNEPLILDNPGKMPAELQPDHARLSLLGAVVFVPMPGATQLIGWLALGKRRSGEPYTGGNLKFLQGLCDQAALVVERLLVLKDLERRVREMNVLTRVAQGVSFTLAFDDILELISAQTNQVLPARNFHVTLLEKDTGSMFCAFCLENDERLTDREGRPLFAGRGLDVEVITNQQSIITNDYEQECRLRGLLVDSPRMFAWMGVPLNAGAETIGAISIASRDPLVSYTAEQCNLCRQLPIKPLGQL